MRRHLLDTSIVLPWVLNTPLAAALSRAIAGDDVAVSVVSHWELATKVSTGKLQLDLPRTFGALDPFRLDIAPEHVLAYSQLPLHHRDPFDRMLVAQAQVERRILVTTDETFRAYDIEVLVA